MTALADYVILRDWDRAADESYVIKSWLGGYPRSRLGRCLGNVYWDSWRRVINRWLELAETRVTCASLKTEPRAIVGFTVATVCPDRTIVHWVTVREPWRGQGIARYMLGRYEPVENWTYTHVLDRAPPGWFYEAPIPPYTGPMPTRRDFAQSLARSPRETAGDNAKDQEARQRQAER